MEVQIFDRLWINAWRVELTCVRANRAAKLIKNLAELGAHSSVIDFGCGTGLIAHSLSQYGVCVTGIDRSADVILEANCLSNPLCQFILADWRKFKPERSHDCAIFWFTTLCSGKELDTETLGIARSALRSDGILLIETRHWDRMPRRFDTCSERRSDGCTLVEHHSYDPETGIQTTEERYFIGTKTVSRTYQTRRYGFAELRDMCLQAGFDHVEGFDEAGLALSEGSERMVLRGRLRGSTR